ncbi:MAG: alpha/beta hydrolase [Chloroflexi bacterium]|nr:alpha/beta hydrolase [Chloroflexota bacterium]
MPDNVTFLNAPNRFVEAANGVNYAYRRIGPPTGVPLVLLQHFRGNLDNWDPALIDDLAREREVIAFDNTGIGLSSGTTPSTIAQMATDAIAFVSALALTQVDLLGFSIGGFVAQEMVLIRPNLVRRLVLAATAPQGAPGMHGWRQDILEHASKATSSGEDLLYIFFKHTPTSQAAGVEFLKRFSARTEGRDKASTLATRDAHYDAIVSWGVPNHSLLERLSGIGQPVFVANGDDDLMILPRYTHVLGGLIPNATTKIYPDAAHAFLFQYPHEFAADVNAFLGD